MICLNVKDGEPYEVFDVKYNSCGYPMFLIYKNGEWVQQSAKYFTPIVKKRLG